MCKNFGCVHVWHFYIILRSFDRKYLLQNKHARHWHGRPDRHIFGNYAAKYHADDMAIINRFFADWPGMHFPNDCKQPHLKRNLRRFIAGVGLPARWSNCLLIILPIYQLL